MDGSRGPNEPNQNYGPSVGLHEKKKSSDAKTGVKNRQFYAEYLY